MIKIPTPSLRTVAIVIGVLLLIGGAWYAVATLTGGKAAQVKGKLDSAVAGAAVSNAADAVTVVQERAASETNLNIKVTNAQSAVRAASDGAGADAAGRAGLCSISASFCAAS
ncbi:hypothetical protein [Novosphingobium rosa]|uniref:hypothetical protein n=1 Tax=Novosphingobium rosa TaxID=76978 RepID=UPI00082C5074|nr:hypothetical protein [Novosphingobium rosa]